MAPQESSVTAMRLELEEALRNGELRPENPEGLVRILSPLERAVAGWPEAPAEDHTASGELVALLWSKTHPSATDGATVLRNIQCETHVVRMLAAMVLGQLLDSRAQDARFLNSARAKLQSQRARETSPVVSLLLSELLTRIARMTATTRLAPRAPSLAPAGMVNPYNAGLPIRDKDRFFGRKKILEQIGATLSSDEGVKSVVLVGARRSGKSSLLYQIAAGALGNGFVAGHVDMQALSTPDWEGLLKLIRKSCVDMCARNGVSVSSSIDSNPYEAARAAIAFTCSSFPGRRVLILLDEYEALGPIFQEPEQAARLQGILENEPFVFFVFAGSQKPDALAQRGLLTLLDNSRTITISFLEPEEARQLITEQVEGYLKYPPEALESIERLCHGHPFYTQLLCQMIFDAKPGGGEVSEADILKVMQAFLQNPSAHTILTWKSLTPRQKLAAACVAASSHGGSYVSAHQIRSSLEQQRYPSPPSIHDIQRGLRDLQDLDLLEKLPGEASFRFTMDLLRQWIAEYRTIWDLRQELAADYHPASLKRRLAAGAVDWLIANGVCLALYQASPTVWAPMIVLLLYFPAVTASAGRTIGMRCWKLRVLRTDGRTVHPLRLAVLGLFGAMECALASLLLLMIYFAILGTGPGWWWKPCLAVLAAELPHLARIAVNQRHQGLWEALVDTMVVKTQEGDDE